MDCGRGCSSRSPKPQRARATLHAWLYSIGETFILGLLALGLIVTLRDRRRLRPSRGRECLLANNYGVYLLHLPILVALQYGLRELDLSGFVKFLLAGAAGLLLSFLLSDRLRRLPGFRKVLQG